MRPLKLTISAFCSYIDEQVIDFEKLGRNGVYLITGDTGAGKTTIFDAITFALYGNASGETRTGNMLRSKMADERKETFVELLFEHNGRKYTVKRRYKIVKRRNGVYESETTPEAALAFDDNSTPITKSTDVTNAINGILGINREQFVRISMIAQGEFSKILIAKTADECKERKQILRRLFGTEIYERFKNELDSETKRLKDDKKDTRIVLQQEIKNIRCDDGSSLSAKAAGIENRAELDEPVVKEIIEELTALISNDKLKIDEYEKAGNSVDAELKALSERVRNAETFEQYQNEIEKFENQLADKMQQKSQLEDDASKNEENQSEIRRIKAEQSKLESEIDKYDELDELFKNSDSLSKEIRTLNADSEKLGSEISALENKLDDLKNKITEIGNVELRLSELEKSKTENENVKKDFASLKEQLSKYNSKLADESSAQKKALEAQNEADCLNKEASDMRRRFNLEQAGIMAENLSDGESCPVCGSTVHPKKAVKAVNAPTQADVESCEEKASLAQKKANDESAKCSRIMGELSSIEEKLQEDEQRLAYGCSRERIGEYADEKIKQSSENLAQIEKHLLSERKARELKEKIDNELPEFETALTEKRKSLEEKRSEKLKQDMRFENLDRQISEKKDELTYSSKSQAENALSDYRRKESELQKLIDGYENSLSECKSNIDKISGSLKTLKDGIVKLNVTDSYENLKSKYDEKDNERKQIIEKTSVLKNRTAINEEKKKNILSRSEEYNKLCSKEIWLTNLYNVAAGKISGKRTDLETYILIAYFDRVIGKANVHMMNMTSNKFELVQRMKNDEAGELKLDVRNTYDNVTYGVDSLSGGEKFIASLSLALGLSEVVQENAGGIKLDTMFVDEGFGSLSDNVLRLAINTLSSLGNGNRLIGIISHVPTLNEALDKKIVVRKTEKSGSRAEVVC